MADRFPLIANPSTSTIQEIPSGDTLDLTGNNIKGAGIITATTFSGNLTGSVTGNAGGLTGTPNVVVGTLGCGNVTSTGDVTGVNATFSGNLTVQGTTTTIDTAVTAVDSLNVDGAVVVGAGISAVGDVSIGSSTTISAVGDVSIGSSTTEIFANGRATFGDRIVIGTIGSSAGTYGAILGPAGSNRARLFFYSSTTGEPVISIASAPDASTTKTVKATIGNDGSASFTSVSDSIGPLRRLGINAHNAATYTLVAGDAGKLIREATNSANITIPQNVFNAGDMISIFNVSGGDNTITSGSGITLYNTADGATGNRTLAAKGVCTIVCTDTNEFIISGSGLS
tara:strand:- start:1630 stop:2652 length:1023 start_codon:yes stop_codon:yes gene_type:complete